MARPRLYQPDAILDAAEQLLAEGDSSAVSIRALAQRTGASSGSLYHSFGSRAGLLGHVWLRAARRFLDLQRAQVDAALAAEGDPREVAVTATIAAATTIAVLRQQKPASAHVLIDHRRETILAEEIPDELATAMKQVDAQLLDVLRDLATALFGRADRRSTELVACCVVDLPPGLLNGRRHRTLDPEALLADAIRGVLAVAET